MIKGVGVKTTLILSEPICAVGLGVAALCCARQTDTNKWSFANYSMTAVSESIAQGNNQSAWHK